MAVLLNVLGEKTHFTETHNLYLMLISDAVVSICTVMTKPVKKSEKEASPTLVEIEQTLRKSSTYWNWFL